MGALPDSPFVTDFHMGGSTTDLYKLPIEKTAGTCMVIVELAQYMVGAYGSWLAIGIEGSWLNIACANLDPETVNFGGYSFTGLGNGIKVTLVGNRVGGAGAGGGNETVGEAVDMV